MANICEFTLRIRGKGKDLKKFAEYLCADYRIANNGSPARCSKDHHIGYRIFDVWGQDELLFAEDEEILTAELYCDCAWSMYSCLMTGEHTYISENEDKDPYVWSIEKASENLHIELEAYSSEPGMCFAEHIYIKDGKKIIDDCVDYEEIYVEDYESYRDLLDDVNLKDEIKARIDEATFERIKHSDSCFYRMSGYDFYDLKWRLSL